MPQDFYDVLGVSRDADEDEINAAFREMAAEYHPDVSDAEDAEEKFKKAKKAKEVLTDDEQRRMYDQLGHEQYVQAEKRGATDNGGRGGGAGAGGMGGMGGMGGQDPFGGMGGAGGAGSIFEQFFGGGGRGRSGPQSGSDLRTRLNLDLQEAHDGVERQLTVRRPETCEDCGGRGHPADAESRTCPNCDGQGRVTQVQQTPFGRVQQEQACPRCEGAGELFDETCSGCGGDGEVEREATLTVDIPAGIRDGQTLRMDGEGAPGDRGAPNGDLLIEVSVSAREDFERDGDDLRTHRAISFPQAVFGDTLELDTLGGSVEFDVPAGTQSGETFRLRGKGMPHLRGRGQGDLYVEVQVVTPQELNAEQREALEAFAEAGGEEIDVEEGFFERLKNSL
jgi:molecular chaperone DnaJ